MASFHGKNIFNPVVPLLQMLFFIRMVAIYRDLEDKAGFTFNCGGTLVAADRVVTGLFILFKQSSQIKTLVPQLHIAFMRRKDQ